MTSKRYWINQPSTHQPLHKYHGMDVLAHRTDYNENMSKVYFLEGDVISMVVPNIALSPGWKE